MNPVVQKVLSFEYVNILVVKNLLRGSVYSLKLGFKYNFLCFLKVYNQLFDFQLN